MENPWQTPEAPLEQEPAPGADLMPYEVKTDPFSARLWNTLTLVLRDPMEAGRRLGGTKALGPAMSYFACLGLSLQWLGQIITALGSKADQSQNEMFASLFHLPPPPAPTPEQQALQRTMLWVGVLMGPFFLALGALIMGLLAHVGMWMLGGLSAKRGLEVTFRTMLYVTASTAWLNALMAFGVFIPGPGGRVAHLLLTMGIGLCISVLAGITLAHAHGERPWKGILGVILPYVILACLCGCCVGVIVGMMGKMPR